MTPIATIGPDIAKTVFQVHGVDAAGQVVIRQRLTRRRVLAFFEKLPPVESRDGTLSKDEYLAIVEAGFKAADVNADGTVDCGEAKSKAGRALLRLLK